MKQNVEGTLKTTEKLGLWDESNVKKNIAPLAPLQTDSYLTLQKLCSTRNIPTKKVGIHTVSLKDEYISLFGKSEVILKNELNFFIPAAYNIKNPTQLYEKFCSNIMINQPNRNVNPYRSYLELLEKLRSDQFLPIQFYLNEINCETKQIDNEYIKVNSVIKQLHDDCEHIKVEQEQFTKFMDQIDATLCVFDRIDIIQERLMKNNGLPIGQDSCIKMLEQIYKDMDFLRNKPNYKDAPLYLAKSWNQARKLLGMTKIYIFKILDQAFYNADPSNDVPLDNLGSLSTKDSQKSASLSTFDADDSYTKLYGKFRATICRAKNLVEHLELHSHHTQISENSSPQKVFSVLPTLGDQLDEGKENVTILNECLSHYMVKREKLILPLIKNTMEDLLSKHLRDHCQLFRSAVSFFSNLCNDEINLYNQLFSVTNPLLNHYLEGVCAILSDTLRSRILHINHLETLSELCSVLKFEADPDLALDFEESKSEKVFPGGVSSQPRHVFTEAIYRLLGDVCERIIYRTHVYVESDIRGYQPSPGDLAYPQKLKMIMDIADTLLLDRSYPTSGSSMNGAGGYAHHYMEGDSRSRTSSIGTFGGICEENSPHGDDDSTSETESLHSTTSTLNSRSNFYRRQRSQYGRSPSIASASSSYISSAMSNLSRRTSASQYPNSPSELYGLWYPTVRRTIVCLSKLNRCLDKSVFQSLSQDVLSACLESLTTATSLIRTKSSSVDAQLFLIKHLLIAREQIAPFQSKFAHREISLGFSNVKDAALRMFQHKYAFLSFSKNNAFLEFVMNGAPEVQEKYLDSRQTVDDTLKLACQQFVQDSAHTIIGDLDNFIHRIKPLLLKTTKGLTNGQVSGESNFDLNTKDCDTDKLHAVSNVAEQMKNFASILRVSTTLIKGRLSLYLTNPDTEYILFRPLRLQAQKSFTTMRDLIEHYYSHEEQNLIACPTFEQVSQILSESICDKPLLPDLVKATP